MGVGHPIVYTRGIEHIAHTSPLLPLPPSPPLLPLPPKGLNTAFPLVMGPVPAGDAAKLISFALGGSFNATDTSTPPTAFADVSPNWVDAPLDRCVPGIDATLFHVRLSPQMNTALLDSI